MVNSISNKMTNKEEMEFEDWEDYNMEDEDEED